MRAYQVVCLCLVLACESGPAGVDASPPDQAKAKDAREVEPAVAAKLAPGSQAETAAAPTAKKPNESPPRPTPDPGAELLIGDFYRAPGAAAILTLPGDIHRGSLWQVTDQKDSPSSRSWSFEFTAPLSPTGKPEAFLVVMVTKFAAKVGSDEDLARDSAARGIEAFAGIPSPSLALVSHPGGTAIEATGSVNGWLVRTVAIADDKHAVTVALRTSERVADFANVTQVHDKLVDSIRVGSKVPALPASHPGEVLEGVYVRTNSDGVSHRFLTFFASGYYHRELPVDLLDVDMSARFQSGTARLGSYTLDDGTLARRWVSDPESSSKPFAHTSFGFTLDGEAWYQLDRAREPEWTLDGHWQATRSVIEQGAYDQFSFFASKNYYFTADGRFSFDSFAAARSTELAGTPLAVTGSLGVRAGAGASLDRPRSEGRYRVAGDRLVLHFDDGREVTQSFYPLVNESSGTPMRELVYIGGSLFSSE